MSVLKELSDRANSLLDKYNLQGVVKRQTQVYDSSLNTIAIAGIPVVGVVSSSVSAETVVKQEQGVDSSYVISYETFEPKTLTLTLLPTSPSNQMLYDLKIAQQKSKGWFSVSIHENGVLEGVYRSNILSMSQKDMQLDSNDRQYILSLNKITKTEVAITETTANTNTTQADVVATVTTPTTVKTVTQEIENIPNTQLKVLENKTVGENVVCFPQTTNN